MFSADGLFLCKSGIMSISGVKQKNGDIMDKLCKRVKKLRIALDMSQQELADKLGYKSASGIARIENGNNSIPFSKVEAFAKALNVSATYLFQGSENSDDDYYFDKETATNVRNLHDRSDLRNVLNSTAKASPDAIKEIQKFIEFQLAKEEGRK